jgi:hypothetical protein
MHPTPDPARLFTDRSASYVRLVRFVRHPEGLREYFVASPLLRPGLRVPFRRFPARASYLALSGHAVEAEK